MALLTDLRIYIDGGDIIARTGASGDTDTHLIADTGLDLNENSGIITIYKISNPSDNKKALWSNCNDEAGTVLGGDADAVKAVLDAMVVPAGGGANISDTAYGVSWNGDTTDGASKNALYDVIETLSGGGASPIGLVEEGNGNATSGNTIWEWKNDYFVDFIDPARELYGNSDPAFIAGSGVLKNNGNLQADANFSYIDYFKIEAGDYEIRGWFDGRGAAIYDIDKEYVEEVNTPIGGPTTTAFTISDPRGAYMRCSCFNGFLSSFFLQKMDYTVAVNNLTTTLNLDYKYQAWVDDVSGLDSNTGTKAFPYKTINKALEGIDGRGREIIVREGDYYEQLALDSVELGSVKIISYGIEKVRIMGSEIITGVTKTAGRTLIYEAPFTATIEATGDNVGYGYRIFEDGVGSMPITLAERNALQRSQVNRLPYTEIQRIPDQGSLSLNLDYLDALGAGEAGFWDDGTDIYMVNAAHGDVSAQDIHYAVRANTDSRVGDSVNNRSNVDIDIRGLQFFYSNENGLDLYRFGKANVFQVSAFGARLDGITEQLTQSTMNQIEAGGCGTDGVASLLFFGSDQLPRNKERWNSYENMWCHDCYDDGFSQHQNGSNSITNFLFEYCGDTGYQNVTGCYSILKNGLSRENGSGVVINGGALTSTNRDSTCVECWNVTSVANGDNYISNSNATSTPAVMNLHGCISRDASGRGYIANTTNAYLNAYNCKSENDATNKLGAGVTVYTDTDLV